MDEFACLRIRVSVLACFLFLLFTTLLAATACDLVPATQQLSSLTPTKQIITDSPTPTLYLTNIPDSNGPRGPNGPSGVPVVPNASLIKAKIVSISKTPENITLGLLVLESKPISGYPDFGANVVNSEINAIWQDAGEIPLSVDQIIMGELSYQGDEREGFYLLRNIIKP